MKYVVNLTKLKRVGITPTQHLLALLIHNKDSVEMNNYIRTCGKFSKEDVLGLVNKGLIVNNNKEGEFVFSGFQVTQEGTDFLDIGTIDDFTAEFLKIFPSTTPNGRKLKQASKKDVETLYNKCHNNEKKEHQHILDLLKKEINDRRTKNSLNYMQSIKVWLRNKSYLAYEEEDNDDSNINLHGSNVL